MQFDGGEGAPAAGADVLGQGEDVSAETTAPHNPAGGRQQPLRSEHWVTWCPPSSASGGLWTPSRLDPTSSRRPRGS